MLLEMKQSSRKFFEKFEERDVDGILDLFDEKGAAECALSSPDPHMSWKGKDELRRWLDFWMKSYKFKFIITEMLSEGRNVVVTIIYNLHHVNDSDESDKTCHFDYCGTETVEFEFTASRMIQNVKWIFDSVGLDSEKGHSISCPFAEYPVSTSEQVDVFKRRSSMLLEFMSKGCFTKLLHLFSDNVMIHDATGVDPFMLKSGKSAIEEFMKHWTSAFRMKCDIKTQICEGYTVFTRFSIIGTHYGEFMGMPESGKTVKCDNASILLRFNENNKIVRFKFDYDHDGFMKCIRMHPMLSTDAETA